MTLQYTLVTDEGRSRDKFVKEHWAMMTYRQMAEALGVGSVGSICNTVKMLKRRGELPTARKRVMCP